MLAPNVLDRVRRENAFGLFARELNDALLDATQQGRDKPDMLKDLPPTLEGFTERFPILVEGKPIDLVNHRYLQPVYASTRFDQGDHFTSVLMTGAQVGKTVKLLSDMIFAACRFWGESFGYFLPDQNMSDIFSSQRWVPIMRSHPLFASLSGLLKSSAKAEDRKRVRKLGESVIYFWYMGGKTSTEALPMRGVFFDEVRRMHDGDIQRAMERMSHCSYPIDGKISTAGYPDSDIHHYFKLTNQQYFHTKCKCPDGVVLAERWPECVGVRGKDDFFYRCPTCSMEILDPQEGRFVAREPERTAIGFHIPQILSPVMTCKRLFTKYQNASDRQEFMNSGLGMPWVDPTSIMVPLEVAMACVEPTLQWAAEGVNCLMGVDQRGGENHVVICDMDSTGKLRLRHLQMIQGEGNSVFADLYPLMQRYDVDCCVIDALPSYNEAVTFAKRFKKRVFLAYYSENVNMARWSDRDKELIGLRKAAKESKFEWHVMLDRYKSLEWTMTKWVDRRIICPEPKGLAQKVKVHGVERISHLCLGDPDTHEQGLFYHLRSAAKRRIEIFTADTERRERCETGQFRMIFENIGIDPHFLHAMNYCAIASTRRTGGTELFMPQDIAEVLTPQELVEAKPTLPLQQASDITQLTKGLSTLVQPEPVAGTCGACRHYEQEKTYCQARNFVTKAAYPSCETFEPIQIEKRRR